MSLPGWAIAIGIVLLLAGAVLWRASAAIDEAPTQVDAGGLVALLDAPPTTVRAVAVDVVLDPEGAWHPTQLARPAHSRCAPSEVRVRAPHEITRAELGCGIQVQASLGPRVELREETSAGGRRGARHVVGGRWLAPLAGTECRVFVLSGYAPDDDSTRDAWASRTSFRGALTWLDDVNENVDGLVPTPAETAALARGVCPGVSAGALLVIEAPPPAMASLVRRRWTAVRGTGGRVLVEHSLGGRAISGRVEATLEVHDAAAYPELSFESATRPATIGVLTAETAAERNRFGRNLRWVTLGGGSGLLFLGIAWSFVRGRRVRSARPE